METLSVTLRKQLWRCVLDPVLMLCSPGLESIALTKQLGHVVELWVFRELFQILDDTPLYLDPTYPQAAYQVSSVHTHSSTAATIQHIKAHTVQEEKEDVRHPYGESLPLIDQRSLNAWEHIRRTTDLGGCEFYWFKDEVCQSRLPEWIQRSERPDRRLQSYELLAQSLETQSLTSQESHKSAFEHPLIAACRDTVALSASLGSAFILAAQHCPNAPPYLVDCLHRWGIPCQQLSSIDTIAKLEQSLFHKLFVEVGLTKLLWSKTLQLAIVHLSVPAAFDPDLFPENMVDEPCEEASDFNRPWELENIPFTPLDVNPWEDAQVHWYPLNPQNVVLPAPATHGSPTTV